MDGARSESLGGRAEMWGHNLTPSPSVETGLTDLPKFWEACAQPALQNINFKCSSAKQHFLQKDPLSTILAFSRIF